MAAGNLNYERGSIEAGLANGEKLLEANPAAAALQARALIEAEPQNTAAHRLFAKAMSALGRAEDARMARARAVQFSRHVPAIAEAHKATLAGRPDRAEAMLRGHLARFPDDPVALMVSGEALVRMGNRRAAVRNFEAALAFMPEYVEARVQLVRVYQNHFDPQAALTALEPLLDVKPEDVSLLRWQASLLSNLGEQAQAAEILGRAARVEPDNPELWISLGDELRTLGRREEANAAYRSAADCKPPPGRAWWGLAALSYAPFDADDRSRMEAALTVTPRTDLPHVHFALAVAHEQADELAEAFAQFSAGNALQIETEAFDPATVGDEVTRSRKLLTPEFFTQRAGTGSNDPAPIFIVGMPRSGSTLVEQILASHPEIEGTAELPIIPVLIRELAAESGLEPGTSYRELLPRIDPASFAAIGEEYLRLAQPHRKEGKRYFLDKLPHNWADAGFIKLILPRAKIVDVRRAPMDCCWSNFKLLFARGHPSSNSLEGMAAYYRHYVAMMDHWDEVVPGAVHRVIYERLVDNFEPEVRRLLDYIGVAFDPACLSFHTNSRSVATASSDQVRRPLNRKGIGAWQAYEEWLGPLKDAVGELEQTYAG